ncbi:F-actin-capping protein [Blyttiomyces sp. JEL0837]|nr:F-actin-capping protein [Blyttiomyces sp. JEL0837]
MEDHEKLQLIRKFILDAPPGEINDVFNDVRVLVGDDDFLYEGVKGPFAEYNMNSFLNVKSPSGDHQVLITNFGHLGESRYIDPRAKQSFSFDHVRQTPSDPQPYDIDQDSEEYRKALDDAVTKYISEHFPDGASTVYSGEDKKLHIAIVDNKFNPNNFWNGRWTSSWTVTVGSAEVTGNVHVKVHYYEDGNVQLDSTRDLSASLASVPSEPSAFATAVIKQITKLEADYQNALNESYAQLSDSLFKSLRRALPISRNRVDWHAISTYKIGSELAKK